MDSLILIASICLYLMSLIAGLLLTFLASRLRNADWNRLFLIHLSIAALSLLGYFILGSSSPLFQIGTLLAFCSALLISGWGIRASVPPWRKMWTGLSLGTLPIFLFSPALLFYVISGNLGQFQPEVRFSLGRSYYLVEQGSMLEKKKPDTDYKLIRRFGFFNRTLARDLNFGGAVDSIQIRYLEADSFNLEGRRTGTADWINRMGSFKKSRGGLTQIKPKTNSKE